MKRQLRLQFSVVLFSVFVAVPLAKATAVVGEVIHRIDFAAQADGDATKWLKAQGYEFKLDVDDLSPRFEDGGLVLETDSGTAGLIVTKIDLQNVETVRVTWGVDRYPQGADWSKGVYRVPIAVVFSFGDEKIGSGSAFVPNAPYFISVFLGEKEQEGKAYTAKYYNKGGRYYCTPCNQPVGETVTTEFRLGEAFKRQFDVTPTPPISSFGFQMNTKDTKGGARAFLQTVEFLSN